MYKASPLAKKIIKEKNLIIENIKGSGPNGRIIKRDLIKKNEEDNLKFKTIENFQEEQPSQIRKVIAERTSEAFKNIHIVTIQTLRKVFPLVDPLYGWVPMYPSGWWSWTFAAVEGRHYQNPLKKRADAISPQCKIWSEKWQKGAFEAMPAFIERALI